MRVGVRWAPRRSISTKSAARPASSDPAFSPSICAGSTVISSSIRCAGRSVASWWSAFWYCAARRAALRMFWLSALPEPSVETATGIPIDIIRMSGGIPEPRMVLASGLWTIFTPVSRRISRSRSVQLTWWARMVSPSRKPIPLAYSTSVIPYVSTNQRVVPGSSEECVWMSVPWSRAHCLSPFSISGPFEKNWSGPGMTRTRGTAANSRAYPSTRSTAWDGVSRIRAS